MIEYILHSARRLSSVYMADFVLGVRCLRIFDPEWSRIEPGGRRVVVPAMRGNGAFRRR